MGTESLKVAPPGVFLPDSSYVHIANRGHGEDGSDCWGRERGPCFHVSIFISREKRKHLRSEGGRPVEEGLIDLVPEVRNFLKTEQRSRRRMAGQLGVVGDLAGRTTVAAAGKELPRAVTVQFGGRGQGIWKIEKRWEGERATAPDAPILPHLASRRRPRDFFPTKPSFPAS